MLGHEVPVHETEFNVLGTETLRVDSFYKTTKTMRADTARDRPIPPAPVGASVVTNLPNPSGGFGGRLKVKLSQDNFLLETDTF